MTKRKNVGDAWQRPITIENDLGIGIILPIRTDGELEDSVIVDV